MQQAVSLAARLIMMHRGQIIHVFLFFFNDTATTEIYTLSLHDALPISENSPATCSDCLGLISIFARSWISHLTMRRTIRYAARSEEHTSELQSHSDLVCRLLLEKKKT